MSVTRTEQIAAADGGTFSGHLALPTAGHGPGVLLIQEIFGVNAYVRAVADRLAGLGYVALAPDVFWRVEEGVDIDSSDPTSIEPAIAIASKWDAELGLDDLGRALQHLGGLDEVTGAVGVIGFCFGGTQTYRVATAFDPACAVSYYGSGIAELLDDVEQLTCPIMFHFGDNDPYIPRDQVDAIKAATADRHNVVMHVHRGGNHAFDNHLAPHFSQPDLAAVAWTETASFLYLHLGGPGLGA